MTGGADLIARLDEAAAALAARALAAPAALPLPEMDWLAAARRAGTLRRPLAWRNLVVATPAWRRLHVEFLAIPGEIAVLHCCGMPQPHLALPVLGFDVVAGREKATGCFLDLSPTVAAASPAILDWAAGVVPLRAGLGEQRALPDWASIFSPHVVAVRPRDPAEVEAGLALGEATMAAMLALARIPAADPAAMAAAQSRYVEGQRRNDRTRRMLAGCIGAPLADAFIADCLFPLPATPALAA
ncbi:hypothetical protein [Paracraurococcus ruber]|uniref:Phycocyanobilin:ferredoxin oxidoreductase n=1 Tax=Paracraurococcus ruber TaxID=77675 RepID=A0ABS1CYK1_9PROT|nr:hypothetical protein [Paracraurococcus ruber]MBK1659286.1 hypothetical protein [Paracraurococcus ruber]TDG33030.1 hypothetical protein E2C05_05110 [Paracraurococcus ruber]